MAAAAASGNKIESAQDIQTWFTGYGLDVDAATIAADKVKIPRRWDDSFSAFNGVVQQSGMDLTRYKGKTVEKWTALLPAVSKGDTMSYGVLLVYKKKGHRGLPAGEALRRRHRPERRPDRYGHAGGHGSLGEDFSGDWGERHDEELGASGRPWRPRARISAGTGASAMTRS